jgi:hypothetical protein
MNMLRKRVAGESCIELRWSIQNDLVIRWRCVSLCVMCVMCVSMDIIIGLEMHRMRNSWVSHVTNVLLNFQLWDLNFHWKLHLRGIELRVLIC